MQQALAAIFLVVSEVASNTVQSSTQTHDFVIPAQAGIQAALLHEEALMDSRLRGNDGLKGPD